MRDRTPVKDRLLGNGHQGRGGKVLGDCAKLINERIFRVMPDPIIHQGGRLPEGAFEQSLLATLQMLHTEIHSLNQNLADANIQNAESSESSGKLAKTLNRFTFTLVIIGGLQLLISAWYVYSFVQSLKH